MTGKFLLTHYEGVAPAGAPPVADVFGVAAHPVRRAIMQRLATGEKRVTDLAVRLPVSRPAVSQHLRVLKEAGLVAERAAGTRRIYRLNEAGVLALRDQLDTFWDRALAAYQDVAEEQTEEEP